MPSQQPVAETDSDTSGTEITATRVVNDESLVIRNYDNSDRHEVEISCLDHHGDLAFDRTVCVGPQETISVRTRLERGVYRVHAQLETGATASAECLIGSAVNECAMIETGNGSISVVEGLS